MRGADPVPENDSDGEFLFLVDEIYRYTGDTSCCASCGRASVTAVAYMDKLRAIGAHAS